MDGPGSPLWQAPLDIATPDRGPIRGHELDLMVRRGGRWWILEDHPGLFAPSTP